MQRWNNSSQSKPTLIALNGPKIGRFILNYRFIDSIVIEFDKLSEKCNTVTTAADQTQSNRFKSPKKLVFLFKIID